MRPLPTSSLLPLILPLVGAAAPAAADAGESSVELSAADALQSAKSTFASLRDASGSDLFELGQSGLLGTDGTKGGPTPVALADSDPLCNENGGPVDPSSGADIERGTAGFAPQLYYCVTTFNSASPDTVQGTLEVMSSILCGIEESGLLDYSGEVQSGSLNLRSDCFAPSLVEEIPSETLEVDVTSEEVSDDSGWTHAITVQSQAFETGEARLKFVLTERHIGFSDGEGTLLLIDRDTGVSRYETLFENNNRHVRVLVKGSMDDSGAYTSISSVEGAWSQGSTGFTQHSVATIKGSEETGYRSYSYDYIPDGAGWVELASACTGSGDCANEAGLVFGADSDALFLLNDGDQGSIGFGVSSGPPCFDSVTSDRFPETCNPGE